MNGMYVVYRNWEVWTDDFSKEEYAVEHIEKSLAGGNYGNYEIIYYDEEETELYWDGELVK